MSPKTFAFFFSALIVFPLDQASKHWILSKLAYGQRIEVIPGLFDLTHVKNPGGAFSFLADAPEGQRLVFFIGTTVIAIGLLIVFYAKLHANETLSATALGVVLGGALGNLTDRIRFGEVVDFLDVHLWGGYTWPTFNVADSAIVMGVALLILEVFLAGEDEATTEEPDQADKATAPHRG